MMFAQYPGNSRETGSTLLNDISSGFDWLVWHAVVYGVPLVCLCALLYIVYLASKDDLATRDEKKPTNAKDHERKIHRTDLRS